MYIETVSKIKLTNICTGRAISLNQMTKSEIKIIERAANFAFFEIARLVSQSFRIGPING